MKIGRKSIKEITRLTTVQLLVLFYVVAVVVSTLLLSMPVAHKPHVDLKFLDALFIAVSAVSVTGLSTVPITETLNVTGYFILLFILQFGGIGIMTLGTFIWLLFGRKIGLKDRKLLMVDQNQSTLSGLVQLMRQILIIVLTIEAIGALVLGIYFLQYFPTWEEALLQGLFASISATTNAGFDITGNSLVLFENDYFVQFVNIVLLILGAIGFPVLIEVKEFLARKGSGTYKFSLFTKLTTLTFFALILVGTFFTLLFEHNHYYADSSWHEAFFNAFFHSVSSRNGGLATMDVSEYTSSTLLLLSALMFIGASPSSVGGGIRTTTFAIMLLSIVSYAKGRNSIKVFGREVDPEDVQKSFIVITTAAMICGGAVILLTMLQPSFSLMEIIFEVSSAFGTTGLSMGVTDDLNAYGKMVIITLMFVGRIGIFSFLFLIRGDTSGEKIKYPKEKVIIG